MTRSLITSRAGCAHHARAMGLDGSGEGRLLVVGESFTSQGAALSTGMLGECFEAVLGSVYLDGGRAAARAAFLRLSPFPPTIAEIPGIYAALQVQRKLFREAAPLATETGYVLEPPPAVVEVGEAAEEAGQADEGERKL